MAFPSDITMTPLGQINLTGDEYAIYQEQWSGEFLGFFANATVALPRVRRRELRGAKAAQFLGVGKAVVARHLRGDSILDSSHGILQQVKFGEILVHVDRPLMAAEAVDELEGIIAHYEVREPLFQAMGDAHAAQVDGDLFRVMMKASQDSSGAYRPTTDDPLPFTVEQADADTQVAALLTAMRTVKEGFDTRNIPPGNRYFALPPSSYNLLADPSSQLTQRDFGGEGNGRFADGTVEKAWGFNLLMTNNIPTTDESAASTSGQNGLTYEGDWRNTVGVAWHPMAVGSVVSIAPRVTVEWSTEHQAFVLISKEAVGHGILRPTAACQVRTAVPS